MVPGSPGELLSGEVWISEGQIPETKSPAQPERSGGTFGSTFTVEVHGPRGLGFLLREGHTAQ